MRSLCYLDYLSGSMFVLPYGDIISRVLMFARMFLSKENAMKPLSSNYNYTYVNQFTT